VRNEHWLLPEGIDEILPPESTRMEGLRRELIDLYRSWGYEQIVPPFIEFVESLLSNASEDLDLQTFKLTDQMSGRTLGIRADITPQAARIDAHRLRREAPTRLCYVGAVLLTRSDDFGGSRSPMQVGCELYGHRGVESELEVLSLMLETLRRAGIDDIYLDLGHVGIFRGLTRQAGLDEAQELALFEALQRKALAEIDERLADLALPAKQAAMLRALGELSGENALQRGRTLLAAASPEVQQALAELEALAQRINQRLPDLPLHFDLAELRGYHYHTGVVFAAYAPGLGQEMARGGRYDAVGEVFGRGRPACGFSADLKTLLHFGRRPEGGEPSLIFAPADADAEVIQALRAQGRRVVRALPGQTAGAAEMGCGEELQLLQGRWVPTPV